MNQTEQFEAEKMSVQEAESVVQLWARLQEEQQTQAANPSTKDMAELLGITPEEAQRLLARVRSESKPAPVVEQKPIPVTIHQSPVNKKAIGFGMAAAVLLMGVALSSIFLIDKGPAYAYTLEPPAPITIADPAVAVVNLAPAGSTVTVSGLVIKGEASVSNPAEIESGYFQALISGLARIDTFPGADDNMEVISINMIKALRSGNEVQFSNLWNWEDATITTPDGQTFRARVPIALINDSDLLELTKKEQARILETLASQAANAPKGTASSPASKP